MSASSTPDSEVIHCTCISPCKSRNLSYITLYEKKDAGREISRPAKKTGLLLFVLVHIFLNLLFNLFYALVYHIAELLDARSRSVDYLFDDIAARLLDGQ